MAVSLQSVAPPASAVVPLAPINGDDGAPAVLKVSDRLTLAVCSRGERGEWILARFVPTKGEEGTDDFRPEGWRQTSRVADIAAAIAGGLLA